MSASQHDIIVVGSGLAGAQACQTLLEAGAKVTLLDVGFDARETNPTFPDHDFDTIRRTCSDQRPLFLGQEFEGIPWGALKAGAQLTPQRQYVMQGVGHWLKMVSESFIPFESLANGGLGNAWGAGCYMFSDAEFMRMGFDRKDFLPAYQKVADRIGISASNDDAAPYMVSGLRGIMPAVRPEPRMLDILERYRGSRKSLNKEGFHMGQPALAVLTEDRGARKAFDHSDMEFWHDQRGSVYRPWMTTDALAVRSGFTKISGQLVVSFQEGDDGVDVRTVDVRSGEQRTCHARRLLLCPGVLGSARIVMRSFPESGILPLLCNPYSYVPLLDWCNLGRAMPARKSGMGQLTLFHDPDGANADVSMAALFTYRSLMLFRLAKESPLNFSDGRMLMQYLMSGLTIAGIHHPEGGGQHRHLKLVRDGDSLTGDALLADYRLTDDEWDALRSRERLFYRTFKRLGLFPLKRVDPGMGSSIHYAGTLPVSETERPMHTSAEGRLHGTRHVWVGDASSFRYLPAKGISFTIMANAHRVAENLLRSMRDI